MTEWSTVENRCNTARKERDLGKRVARDAQEEILVEGVLRERWGAVVLEAVGDTLEAAAAVDMRGADPCDAVIKIDV